MWVVQVLWNDKWITLESGFNTRDSAEWAIGQWKQKHRCFRDPFRASQEDLPEKPPITIGGLDLGAKYC